MIALALPALPADLYPLIIEAIPIHPRICVASLVCRRWRQIVLSTIKTLPERMRGRLSEAQRKSFLFFAAKCPLEELPDAANDEASVWELMPPLPQLSRWYGGPLQFEYATSILTTLRGAAQTLTQLSLSELCMKELLSAGLSLDEFPHLRSLSLQGSSEYDFGPNLTFLRSFALTSLTALRVVGCSEPTQAASLFPRLQRFEFRTSPQDLRQLLCSSSADNTGPLFPLLHTLSISLNDEITDQAFPAMLRSACPSLRHLEFPGFRLPASLLLPFRYCLQSLSDLDPSAVICSAPALRRLSVRNNKYLRHYESALTRLHDLDIRDITCVAPIHAPHLTALTVGFLGGPTPLNAHAIVSGWNLPRLRTLQLCCKGATPDALHLRVASTVMQLRRQRFAMLTELFIQLQHYTFEPNPTADLRAFASLVKLAEESGLDRIRSNKIPEGLAKQSSWLELVAAPDY